MPLTGPVQRTRLLIVAAAAFVAVFVLALAIADPRQAITVLYVVPIAITALAAGMRGGIAGAFVSTALLSLWFVIDDIHIGMSGWISRLIAFFVTGALVGRYEDLARTLARRRADEQAATEVHDGVVQALVIATYELQRGNTPGAEAAVEEALAAAKAIISARLPDPQPGDLRLSRRSPDRPDS